MKKIFFISIILLTCLIFINITKAEMIISAWNYTYNNPDNTGSDIAWGVAVDSNDNIIVVGYDNSPGNYQWRIMKFNSSGYSLKNYTTNDSPYADMAWDVAVDGNNNIIVVGYDNVTTSYEWRIMKFNSSLDSISNYTVDLSPDYDVAYDVAIDSNDNIIVVGYDNSPGNHQWRIMKFDSNLNSLRNYTYNNPGVDEARGVAVDSNDNIIVVGYDNSPGNAQWRIMKFDSNLNSLRNYTYNNPGFDIAWDVAVDSNDNIIVVGYDNSPGNAQWRIMKFDSNLNSLRNYTVNPSSSYDYAYAVVNKTNDEIIVVGMDRNATSTQWRIMKFNSSLDSIWNYTTNDSAGVDEARGVAVDSNDNIIVVGYDNSPGNPQWRIMKFYEPAVCGDGNYEPLKGEECDWSVGDDPCPHYAYCNISCQCHDFRPEMSGCDYYDYCINGTDATNPTESCCEQKPLGSGITIECCLTGGLPSDCSSPFAVRNQNAIAKYDYCWIEDYDITDVCIDNLYWDHWYGTCPEF